MIKELEISTFELCPNCGEENEMSCHVGTCKECGIQMVACSMCDATSSEGRPCADCGSDGNNFRHKKLKEFEE